MAIARFYTSIAQPTALAGGISNTNTSIQVQATTGFPTSYPYTLALDYGTSAEELVDVTNAAGTTLTVTRGVDGTSAQTHSIGAVVRHTSSGRDFADIQGHIAATSGVHGIAGTLVGTSDAQTLANKTLTSPSISGATLSGTLSGTPTFSGNALFSGAPGFRGASAGASALGVRVTGDTTDRLIVGSDGKMTWGSGSTVGDTVMARTGAGQLTFTANAQMSRSATTDVGYSSLISGDSFERYREYIDGKHEWGSGALARDTTLYRNSAGELKTDGALTIVGALAAGNMNLGAFSSWTPTWTTTTGLHLPAYGNAATAGATVKLGRLLLFYFAVTFGSSTTFGTGVTTADNWGFVLPNSLNGSANFAGTRLICGFGRATQAAGATIPFAVRVDTNATLLTLDTSGGRQDGVSITNTGAMDSLTPWNWANGNELAFWGAVETTT